MVELVREPFGQPVSMRDAYGQALVELGAVRDDLVVLSADVSTSDRSELFGATYPERFINVGIAEQALVDVAVGLANGGKVPIANTFAFLFATRAVEPVRTHLCYGKANVKLAAAYAGLSDSFDGPTHHSITDIAIMRSLPNMTVVVPSDSVAVAKLLPLVIEWEGPVYLRLCRNEVPVVLADSYQPAIGRGVTLRPGSDVTIIGCGVMVARCLQAAERLARSGIAARVVDMHTVKPLDIELLADCARATGAIVTAEEHSTLGGLGGAVAEALSGGTPVPLERIGLSDAFAETGPYEAILEKYGLGVEHIVAAAQRAIARKPGR